MRKTQKKTQKKLTKRPRRKTTALTTFTAGEGTSKAWPIPSRTRLNLRYNDYLKLTSTAGSVVHTQWRMGSLYDPDYTNVGHQPYGYDQISGLFNFYCVISFTVIIRYTALTTPMRVVMEPRYNNASVATDPQLVMERNHSLNWIAAVNETGYKKMKIYLPKLAGQDLANFKQTNGGVPSNNPAVNSFMTLYAQTMDTSATGSLVFDYEFYFDTVFEQAVQQAQS